MAGSHGDHVLRHLHHLLGGGGAPVDDGRLLERFVARRDEEAFAELVARHGPLVYGVCRRVLRDAHDAEDVFQAAFLVLARKAAAIRKPESLPSFLHGVAYRLAIKARAEVGRRREHERQAPPQSQTEEADLSWREVRALLDEELQRLPEKQRLPLVLCYLEGLTQDEAAQRLNWPRGTLKRRLERGRERLRVRLTRRGVTLGATLFAVALTASATKGAVPTALRTATVQAGLLFATGATAGIADTRAVLLAKGGLQTMMMTKPKLAALLILMLTCAAAAAGLMSQPAPVEKTPEQKTDATAPPGDEPKQVRKDRNGDPLPAAALVRLGTVRLRHLGNISPVVFTPDSKTAIVGDRDGNVVCWDVSSGKEIRRLERAPAWLCALTLSADGKRLAAGEYYNRLFLWDVATGKLRPPIPLPAPHGHTQQILFTPDGRTLALRDSTNTILLWDAVHNKKLHELKSPSRYVKCLAVSSDGKTLASGGEGDPQIHLWDIASGKEKPHITGDKSIDLSLAFSPDGKTLAVIGSTSWHVDFFDAHTGKKVLTSKESFVGLSAIKYAPDGKSLAGIERGNVCIVDATNGKRLHKFDAASHSMNGLAFSPDGQTIATFYSVPAECAHAFELWETASGKRRHSFVGHERGVTGLAFAADGKTLFSVAHNSIPDLLVWDANTGELRGQVGEHGQTYNGMALSPDGKLLAACGDREIHLWDAATRKKVRACEGNDFFLTRWAAWSADNRTLVSSGHADRTIRIWDAATGKRRWTIQTKLDNPPQATVSPDGAIVAAGGYPDGTIHLWSAATGKELRTMATPARKVQNEEFVRPGRRLFYSTVYSLAFHSDGSLLASGGGEGDIHLWDPTTGRMLRRWETKAGWIRQLAFAPDGRTLVSAHGDSRVRLWEVATGRERACFTGHRGDVLSVAFVPDGRRVASGSEDTTILIWDATNGVRPDAALSAKQLQTLWADLIGTDAGRAYRSIWRMTLAPKQSLPFLGEQLRRIARLDAEQQEKIARLIADLDSDQFTVREKATGELETMVTWVEPALRKALAGKPSLEVRRRIEKVLEKVAGWSGERLRTLRALEAVEHMNAPEARRLLEELANGTPRAWVTEEAPKIRKRLDG
ncbi:MAG TPA: sigma-70 family RNA polymerase sigma factor [Gemmataceae bacterium]|jgi:RNA polymerase sigma factor (sigma-70 family)